MDDRTAWQAAGIYDPATPDAETRAALLAYLTQLGATLDDMVEADRLGRLPGLAGNLTRRSDAEVFTPRQLAAEGAVSLEQFGRVWRAAGLVEVGADEAVLTAADRETLLAFTAGAEVFGEDALLQFTRTVGAAVATIADAANATVGLTVEVDFASGTVNELELAQSIAIGARSLVDQVPTVITSLFRHHVEAAIRRYLAAGIGDTAVMAVGFLDVVDSTRLTHEIGAAAIGAAMSDFEQRATEIVSSHDGRLVKTIGDEVMYVATTPEAACRIAFELMDFADGHPVIGSLRGSVAWGPLARGFGDFYGPVVTRVTSIGTRMLRGAPEPVELFRVERPSVPV